MQRDLMGKRRLNRRGLFLAAAGATAAAPLVGAGAGDAESSLSWIAGVVESVDGSVVIMRPADDRHGRTLRVRVSPSADELDVVPVGSLVAGDEIVAAGTAGDGGFLAERLERMHRVVRADVSARKAERMNTDAGTLRLTRYSSALEGTAGGRPLKQRSLAEIAPGDDVAAVVYRDSQTGDLVVSAIGVEA